MLSRERVLKYLFVKAIQDTISDEIAGNSLMLKDIREYNQNFVDRVLVKFIDYTLPVFSINEVLDYIRKISKKRK